MKREKPFKPSWSEEAPPPGSYRSIFKWGDPEGFKHPNRALYRMMKEEFALTDDDFRQKIDEGRETVDLEGRESRVDPQHREAMAAIVGAENVSQSDYDRLNYATGYTMEEILELRQKKVAAAADLVVFPRHKQDVKEIVSYCHREDLPLYIYGGGSSVNFGFRPVCGGITLVLNRHMNKIVELNETNKTCTVEAGMMGPDYDEALKEAPRKLGAQRAYCCGHYPQSFEYSSVGGWVVTLGSGQQSSYFGDAADLVLGMEWITPRGEIVTHTYSAAATGPKLRDIMLGSEGAFGVLVEVTLKVFYWQPKNYRPIAFIFKSFEDGIAACREISQGEFGFPGVMRLSDGEESSMGLKLYGVEGTPLGLAMDFLGYKQGRRSLFLARAEGERGFAGNVKRRVKRICRRHGGFSLTGFPLISWEHGRYRDPYLREDLNDYGIMLDTLETSVNWDNLHRLHQGVRAFVKSRPNTMCLTHSSHFYPEGTNLYFIFFCKMNDLDEYRRFQRGIFDAIAAHGGSLSHHHGVGRMLGPYMEEHLGKDSFDVLRTLKTHFDPKNIMNRGGQLGLDYPTELLEGHDFRIDWENAPLLKGREPESREG